VFSPINAPVASRSSQRTKKTGESRATRGSVTALAAVPDATSMC